jgi:flagellar P-ring protein FlgI
MKRHHKHWILRTLSAILISMAAWAPSAAWAAPKMQISDLARIQEVRDNQLVGFGLVVGLNATGDGDKLADQMIHSLLEKKGIRLSANDISSDNVAAVTVTVTIPPFMSKGSKLDVTVSAIGKATSISNGLLIQTPLKGANGIVYAVAQGSVATGSFTAGGEAATVSKNHPTIGRVVNGALVEREIPIVIRPSEDLKLSLNTPNQTTSVRMADAINALYPDSATPITPGLVKVALPLKYRSVAGITRFWSTISALKVEPFIPARVVVSERTGTIIIGQNVRLAATAISHGNLVIKIKETTNTSQPSPLNNSGATAQDKKTDIDASEERRMITTIDEATTLGDVVNGLNAVGATPRDMITILQALKRADALQCELIVL